MRHIYAALVLAIGVTAIAQDATPAKQQQPQAEDATALEARYKTCAKHYIPAEKCTPEIYQQLKAKEDAPLDPKTMTVLSAVKEYRSKLKNPDSMQVHTAYLTDEGAVCLEIGGQNGMGGVTVSRVSYLTDAWPHRGKGKWREPTEFNGITIDGWRGTCNKAKMIGQGDMYPGTDVTEKVTQALKDGK
jgi:hypothetical protein